MTQEHDKIALIDLDGTLVDYDHAMKTQLELLASPGEVLPEDIYGDETPHLLNRMSLIKRIPGFWRSLPKIETGMQVYDLLGELGYSRMILTKGPKRTTPAWTEKVDWCREHTPEAGITVIQHDKIHKGLVYGKVLFDDYPPYIEQWIKWRPRGKVIMLDSVYNRDFLVHPQVLRIKRGAFRDVTEPLIREFLAE